MAPVRRERVGARAVAALGLAALGVRLFRLDLRAIWLDEAYSLNLAGHDWSGIVQGARLDIHPPLFYLVLSSWVQLFGTSEWGARSLSVLCGVLLVPVAFLLADALADRRAAWWTATLVAVSPYFVELSRSARMAALLALVAALSWYFFLKVSRGLGGGVAAGYVLATLAALYTHYFGFLLLLAENAWLFFGLRFLKLPRPVFRRWVWLQLLVLAGCAPWLPAVWQHVRHGGPDWRGVGAAWTEPLHSLWVFALGTACWSAIDKVLAGSALAAAAGLMVRRLFPARRTVASRLAPRDWGQLAIVLVLPLAVVLVYSLGRRNVFDDRYLSFCALAGTILAGVLLSALPRRESVLAGGLVLAGFAVPLSNQWLVNGYRDDWRTVAAALVDASRPGDEIAIFPAWNEAPLQYYLRSRVPVRGLPGHYDPVLGQADDDVIIDGAIVEIPVSAFDPESRVWLVLVNDGAEQEALHGWFRARFRTASQHRYGAVQILEFVPRGRLPQPAAPRDPRGELSSSQPAIVARTHQGRLKELGRPQSR